MSDFKDLTAYFESKVQRLNKKKKSAKYGDEIIRINQNARAKLSRMNAATKFSKRSLASYAIYLLNEEFEKWLKCDQNTKFGYEYETFDGDPDAQTQVP
jgi:hypothetical protein